MAGSIPDSGITRRQALLIGGGLVAFSGGPSLAKSDMKSNAKLGDDGLYHMDWYLESFLDLAEDLSAATAKGKRFAVMWGLKGCPACKRMHEVHLSDPKIESYIHDNFEILHLNILGAREVTDFGGAKFGEKALSATYNIRATPAIQFFPEKADGLAALKGQAREVFRMPGLPEPAEFLAMFRYVRENGYKSAPFEAWLKKQV